MKLNAIPTDEVLAKYREPDLMQPLTPRECMELAAAVALRGVGFVKTNPPVGAVLVTADHRFIAAGAHLLFGWQHAEVALFDNVTERDLVHLVPGSILYCTLEPCSYVGKTPACAGMLARLPLQRVICAALDPNPRVNGQGMRMLQDAGIACEISAEFATIAAPLLTQFRWFTTHKQPFVGIKAAMSLNGVVAPPSGERIAITSERARTYGHWLRMEYEGIAVGRKTLERDNPQLNVRNANLPRTRTPFRIVFDPSLTGLRCRPLAQHNVIKQEPQRTIWIARKDAWDTHSSAREELCTMGVQILTLHPESTLEQVLTQLWELGIPSILLEGGAGLWSSFLHRGLVNRAHLFYAPTFLDSSGTAVTFAQAFGAGQSASLLHDPQITLLHPDFLIEGEVHDERKDHDGTAAAKF